MGGKNMSGTQNIHRSSTARGLTRRKPLSATERGQEPMQENMQGNMQESAPDIVLETVLETAQDTITRRKKRSSTGRRHTRSEAIFSAVQNGQGVELTHGIFSVYLLRFLNHF